MVEHRVFFWWVFVFAVTFFTGVLRYENRIEELNSRDAIVLARSLEDTLHGSGMQQIARLQKGDVQIGYAFKDIDCPSKMRVVYVSIHTMPQRVAAEFLKNQEDYRIYFMDLDPNNVAQISVTVRWAWSLINYNLQRWAGDPHIIRSHHQLAVIKPQVCSFPDVNWANVWEV